MAKALSIHPCIEATSLARPGFRFGATFEREMPQYYQLLDAPPHHEWHGRLDTGSMCHPNYQAARGLFVSCDDEQAFATPKSISEALAVSWRNKFCVVSTSYNQSAVMSESLNSDLDPSLTEFFVKWGATETDTDLDRFNAELCDVEGCINDLMDGLAGGAINPRLAQLASLAENALEHLQRRQSEDISDWAENLARDLSDARD